MEVAADAVGHTAHMEVWRGIARRTAPIHFGPSTPVGKPRHRAADRLATRSGWLGVLFYIHRTDDWATLDAPSTLAQLGIDCRCCGGRRLRGVKPGMRSITDQIQPRAVHDSARSFSCMCTKLAPEPCRMRIGSVSGIAAQRAEWTTPPSIGDFTETPLRWRRKSPCRFMAADDLYVSIVSICHMHASDQVLLRKRIPDHTMRVAAMKLRVGT